MTKPSVAPVAVDLRMRVSLFVDIIEVWQGTLAEFCEAWQSRVGEGKLRPCDVAELLEIQPTGMSVHAGSLPEHWFRRRPCLPDTVMFLTRTQYYRDERTGNAYTSGENIRSGCWDRLGPVRATLCQTYERKPLVTIHTGFGVDGDYTPEQIRAFAQALLRIAGDAENQPMGPRSFRRSIRGYDT